MLRYSLYSLITSESEVRFSEQLLYELIKSNSGTTGKDEIISLFSSDEVVEEFEEEFNADQDFAENYTELIDKITNNCK